MLLRVVAGPGAQGRPFTLVKSTQTDKIAAETASNTVTTENNLRVRVTVRVRPLVRKQATNPNPNPIDAILTRQFSSPEP